LSLPTEAQTLVESGSLSLGQAKVLLALKDPGQILPVAKECIAKSLSVRAVEKIVGRVNLGPEVKPVGDEASLADRALQQLREDLQKVSGSRVEIDYQDGRGRVSMYFYTGDQLNELADRLKKAWSP
jgi:ParB family chromosome partitioning protein